MQCEHQFVQSGASDYLRCLSCGTYKSRAPATKNYAQDYWGGSRPTVWEQVWNVDMHTEGGVSKNRFVIERVEVKRDSALEIGCSPGRLLYWLKHAARFASVTGIEPDESLHDDIRRIGCFDGVLMGGLFPNENMNGWFFDYIAALDVLEHSEDPEGFLKACWGLLFPSGQLFLMLPLADGTPECSKSFNAAEHNYLHSFHNLRVMLESAGFSSIRRDCWTVGHDTVSARK